MKVIPYYIFYVAILGILPILIMFMWTVALQTVMFLLLISFFGGIYSIPKSIKTYEKIGFEQVHRAYITLTILRESWRFISIVSFGIYAILLILVFTVQPTYFTDTPQASSIPIISFVSLFSYVITHLVFIAWEKNRDFRLFMCRESCKNASAELERIARVKNLLETLRWYDKYIRLAMKLKLANLDEISSKFLTQGSYEQGQTISQFYKAFVAGDELEPLNLIKTFANSTDGTNVLAKENVSRKWKEWTVPITIGIIGIIGQFASVILQSLLR